MQGDGPASTLPENLEPGPADRSLLEFAGEMDVSNRYASAVMVSFSDRMEEPQCSGVLMGPRVVLTAASCVCIPERGSGASLQTKTIIHASSCARRVFVTTVLTGAVLDRRFKEDTTEMKFRAYQGVVHPHSQLQLVLDERQAVVSAKADLAVIVLSEPVEDRLLPVLLAQSLRGSEGSSTGRRVSLFGMATPGALAFEKTRPASGSLASMVAM
jgi:hypothetical protein